MVVSDMCADLMQDKISDRNAFRSIKNVSLP